MCVNMQIECDRIQYPFAEPRHVTNLSECSFYHTMELPGFGVVQGEWDLRRTVDSYLGGVEFKDKRVLDVGTTDGFLCFHAEQKGARKAAALDLSPQHDWDIVPFAGLDTPSVARCRCEGIRRINNAFWLAHRLYQSRAAMIYSDVYSFPGEAGEFDIALFGAILLHLRDPFLALQRVLASIRETVVVVELLWPRKLLTYLASGLLGQPVLHFLPDARRKQPVETWWAIPPATVKQWLAILGFGAVRTVYHRQRHRQRWHWLYTVVARRQAG